MTDTAVKPVPYLPPMPDLRAGLPENGPPPLRSVPLKTQAADWLRTRGVEAHALAWFALALAGAGAIALFFGHPGMGGFIGLVALACGELSLVPTSRALPAAWQDTPLARALSPLVDLLLVSGLLGHLAAREPPAVFALGLLAIVVVIWLDILSLLAPSLRLPQAAELWTRAERVGVLLVGAGLGRPGPALLLVVLVGVLDALLRLERADRPVNVPPLVRWPWIERFLRADGSLVPLVRWVSLAVTLLLLLVLPQSNGWRF